MNNWKNLTWSEGLKLLPSEASAPEDAKRFSALLKKLKLAKEKRPCFVSVDYEYGDFIARNGTFAHSFEPQFKPLLNYARIPLGFLLNAPAEVSSRIGEQRVAATLIRKYSLFGVFETLDTLSGLSTNHTQGNSWDVTAGVASIRINYPLKTIAKTDNPLEVAKKLLCNTDWKCSVLYLTVHILDAIQSSSPELREFLFRYGWEQNQKALKFNALYDNRLACIAEACVEVAASKASPAYFWFFVRLLLVMKGLRPAYRPVVDGSFDHLGPFSSLLVELGIHAERSGRESAQYHTPMMFVPSSISDAANAAYLSICDASPGFHDTKLPDRDIRNAYQIISNALNFLIARHPNDEIVALAKNFNVTPFIFELTKTQRGKKSSTPARVKTKYRPSRNDLNTSWQDSYLASLDKPFYSFQFFTTLVGLQRVEED